MNYAYLLLPLLGLLWALVGVIVSEAKQNGIRPQHFYLTGSICSSALLLLLNIFFCTSSNLDKSKLHAVILYVLGAFLNGSGQALSMSNLKRQGRALAYSIPLLAFLLPYFWSVAFWSQSFTWKALTGLGLITGAIIYLSANKKGTIQTENKASLPLNQIIVAFAALFIIGIAQTLLSIPSQLPAERTLSPLQGAFVLQASSALFFLGWTLLGKDCSIANLKRSIPYGLLWGTTAAASYSVLLPALLLLGRVRQAGIVFPAGCSLTILLFTSYTAIRYRERLSWKQCLAFASVIAGIFLVKL